MFGFNKITMISLVIVAVVSGFLSSQYQTNVYESKISTMVLEYDRKLNVETQRVLEKERELVDLSSKIEVSNNEKQQKIKILEDRVNKLVADGAIRMRDPGSKSNSCSTKSSDSSPSAISNDQTGSELSEELTRFLWSEASRADRVTEQLTSCQLYIETIRSKINVE